MIFLCKFPIHIVFLGDCSTKFPSSYDMSIRLACMISSCNTHVILFILYDFILWFPYISFLYDVPIWFFYVILLCDFSALFLHTIFLYIFPIHNSSIRFFHMITVHNLPIWLIRSYDFPMWFSRMMCLRIIFQYDLPARFRMWQSPVWFYYIISLHIFSTRFFYIVSWYDSTIWLT